MIEIRKGNPEDLEEITYVNRKTWKTTYPTIIEQDFLNNISLTIPKDVLEIKKREIIEKKANYIVALDNNKVIGMLKYLTTNNKNYKDTAEIQALYLLEKYQKKGIGKQMVNIAIKEMLKNNYKNMIIGCLEENPSNEFYKKIGGKYIGKRDFLLNGKTYRENVYFYKNIAEMKIVED